MSDSVETTGIIEVHMSVTAEVMSNLETRRASLESELREVNDLISRIRITKVTAHGYAPANKGKVQVSAKNYDGMTIRAAVRAFFIRNGNRPEHYRKIAETIGRARLSVAAILSAQPEFTRVGDPGMWQADPTWISNGWVVVGR